MRLTVGYLLSYVFALPVLACSTSLPTSQDDLPGGKGETATEGKTRPHTEAIRACEARFKADLDKADNTHSINQAGTDWIDCLTKANNDVVPYIELNWVATDGSPGETDARFERYRTTSAVLCNLLADASPNAGGSARSVDFLHCIGRRELALALLIDSTVDFADGLWQSIPRVEGLEDCYADDNPATCIAKAIISFKDATIAGILINKPELRKEDLSNDVAESFADAVQVHPDLCLLLAAWRTSGEVGASHGSCAADANALLFGFLHEFEFNLP